jgi:hypothetical protein
MATTPTSPARVVDLDKARAARKKAAGDPITVKFAGKEYTLPFELPYAFVVHAQDEDIVSSLRVLLGDQADRFLDDRPSLEDVDTFLELVIPLYGGDA